MYEIFKSVIASKTYNLEEMIKKINTRWVEDTLTEEQRKELIALAQKNADPNLSNAPLQKQIEAIAKQQNALKATVTALSATVQKIKETVESGEKRACRISTEKCRPESVQCAVTETD